jgi:hypothetical protein
MFVPLQCLTFFLSFFSPCFGSQNRKSLPASLDENGILSGTDVSSGGTWLGVNVKTGTIAAITNYDDCKRFEPNFLSHSQTLKSKQKKQ